MKLDSKNDNRPSSPVTETKPEEPKLGRKSLRTLEPLEMTELEQVVGGLSKGCVTIVE
jgi:hypothetical protein